MRTIADKINTLFYVQSVFRTDAKSLSQLELGLSELIIFLRSKYFDLFLRFNYLLSDIKLLCNLRLLILERLATMPTATAAPSITKNNMSM